MRTMTVGDVPAAASVGDAVGWPGRERRFGLFVGHQDRSHLLRALAGPGWVMADDGKARGYHLPVPWGGGPIIAPDPAAARALTHLARTLAGPDETVRFWLAEENEAGLDLMGEMGFEEDRRLPRMVRGWPPRWRPEALWGIFGLGKG